MKLQRRGKLGLVIDTCDMFLLSGKILDTAVHVNMQAFPFGSANVNVNNLSPSPLAIQFVLMQ